MKECWIPSSLCVKVEFLPPPPHQRNSVLYDPLLPPPPAPRERNFLLIPPPSADRLLCRPKRVSSSEDIRKVFILSERGKCEWDEM
jgi:hypothetical protein